MERMRKTQEVQKVVTTVAVITEVIMTITSTVAVAASDWIFVFNAAKREVPSYMGKNEKIPPKKILTLCDLVLTLSKTHNVENLEFLPLMMYKINLKGISSCPTGIHVLVQNKRDYFWGSLMASMDAMYQQIESLIAQF